MGALDSNASARLAQAPTLDTVTIAAAASVSGSVNLGGRSLVRVVMPGTWTAADLTLQTSLDGNTWTDVYDEFGNVYTLKAAASRTIHLSSGALLAVTYLRVRSGTPTTAVAQAAAATLSLISTPL